MPDSSTSPVFTSLRSVHAACERRQMAALVKTRATGLLLVLGLLSGCVANNVVTMEEIETQNRADAVVSGVLFDNDLDTSASYNIRKDGLVVIKFDESVAERTYTDVVNLLRSSPVIRGVQAEQSGREVCPLR